MQFKKNKNLSNLGLLKFFLLKNSRALVVFFYHLTELKIPTYFTKKKHKINHGLKKATKKTTFWFTTKTYKTNYKNNKPTGSAARIV